MNLWWANVVECVKTTRADPRSERDGYQRPDLFDVWQTAMEHVARRARAHRCVFVYLIRCWAASKSLSSRIICEVIRMLFSNQFVYQKIWQLSLGRNQFNVDWFSLAFFNCIYSEMSKISRLRINLDGCKLLTTAMTVTRRENKNAEKSMKLAVEFLNPSKAKRSSTMN